MIIAKTSDGRTRVQRRAESSAKGTESHILWHSAAYKVPRKKVMAPDSGIRRVDLILVRMARRDLHGSGVFLTGTRNKVDVVTRSQKKGVDQNQHED